MSDRRQFLKTATAAAAAVSFANAPAAIGSVPVAEGTQHTLPDLPYPYEALEPFIDAQTMRLHHSKHHAGYVKGLNAAEAALAAARTSGDYSLVQHWSRQAAFNGGGHWLHSMFWKVMAPAGNGRGGLPTGDLEALIKESFGSVQAFQAQFSAAAGAVEGSGWGLLHYRSEDQRLIILQAENQQKLTPWGSTPILGVDVWEHAYYLKYQNQRAEYIKNWWNVVNWKQVESNLQALR
ncbi:MAG: superoxide dismutase [Candidatus Kapaibacteriota bacterium]